MARIVRVLACIASLFTGCQPDEYAILIEAEAALNVSTVVVTVVPMSGGRSFPSGTFRVDRTAEDIESVEPIRIAIELDGPNEVMVHLRARSPDGVTMIASRCYRVSGVVHDSVLLFGTDMLDGDGDGWLADPSESCFAADGTPCTAHQCTAGEDRDCNDADPTFNPGAPEVCADGLDQDCRDGDVDCADDDGDGYDNCSADADPATCDCNDQVDTVHPGADEICEDGVDQDCDGTDSFCDDDGDGYPGNVDCDDGNAAINPGAEEVCTPRDPMTGMELETPQDEDCDGRIDELIECENGDMDGDGQIGCWHPMGMGAPTCDCNDCDRGVNTMSFDQCGNGVDEDCDGRDAECPPGDMDLDGFAGTASGGTDCNDADPRAYPGAWEYCGDMFDQSCDGSDQACDGDTDGDRYVEAMACEGNPAVTPWATEACNGRDDDCDTIADEVLAAPNMVAGNLLPHGFSGCISTDPEACPGMDACSVDFTNDLRNCGQCGNRCNTPERMFASACIDGACICEASGRNCNGNEACCGAAGCQDVESTITQCGACDNDCNAGRPPERPLASQCVDATCQCGGGPRCVDSMANVACCSDTGDPTAASCIDTNTNNLHCGECNHLCGSRMRCTGGGCVCTEAGWDNCNSDDSDGCETDLMTTVAHCGACGMACNLPNVNEHSCVGGACMITSCDPGWGDCNGVDSDGCETPLDTLTNCGVCGNGCDLANASESCSTRSCRLVMCTSGWGNCDGSESNGCETQLTSLTHCGMCDRACNLSNATESCSTGACRLGTCSAGYENCDGSEGNGCEVQLNSVSNCGGCGVPCTRANATPTCSTGTCRIQSCNARFDDCNGTDSDGCETSLSTVMNCQACGSTCPMPANSAASCSFTSGCSFTCNSGYCQSGGMCVRNDTVMNCGSSCNPCTAPSNATPACLSGSCSWTCDSGYCPVSGSCVSNADNVNACGDSCTTCPDRANSSPTCTSGTCGFTCDTGWADCDGMPGNGCETDLSDEASCGACTNACGAGESCNFDSGMGRNVCCCGSTCDTREVCRGGQNCCGMPLMCSGSC